MIYYPRMKLTQSQKIKLHHILKRHDVKRAEVFGSFARGDATAQSDLDILIDFKGRKSLFDLAGLKLDLEDQFGRSVDVVTYRSVNPRLKPFIMKHRLLVV